MKITFHGAARSVTGSQHLLEINGHFLLLECGLFQGKREESYATNQNFLYDPAKVEAVILTHSHIDHCGNLPNLFKKGFEGPVYASHVTSHLAPLLLVDSAHIQEADAEYLNRKFGVNGHPRVEPLYTVVEAERVENYMQRVENNQAFEPVPGVSARLVEAGHILGSTAAVLDIEEDRRKFRFWFSGDIGRWRLPLVRDPVLPKDVDYLLMESTYGDQPHTPPEVAFDNLRKVLSAVIARDGKVVIPAFAVGRTQDLVYEIHKMIEKNEIPKIPVFVDSPLAVKVTDIFQRHPEFFDREAKNFAKQAESDDPLGFDLLTYVQSVEESKAINEMEGPLIIISASGMVENGRVLHHLAHTIEDPRNLILLVSYQAPDTLGRRLAEGARQVKIFGEVFERKADVVNLNGFSAHAGQDLLMEYALASKENLKQVFLVHGEPAAAETLQARLKDAGLDKVLYPYPKQAIEI